MLVSKIEVSYKIFKLSIKYKFQYFISNNFQHKTELSFFNTQHIEDYHAFLRMNRKFIRRMSLE